MLLSVVIGYSLGTAIGDAYAGHATWELLMRSPQRFWGFWLSSLGISLGFLFYFHQREKALDLQRQATEARLKLLETQLEPHMLFNTLANLRALIEADPPRAVAMLDRLSGYLRATLRGSRTDARTGAHTLADELTRLRDYLALMAVRMGPRLDCAFEAADKYVRVLTAESELLIRTPLKDLLPQLDPDLFWQVQPRHRGARHGDPQRAPRRGRQAPAAGAWPARAAVREPALCGAVQGHVGFMRKRPVRQGHWHRPAAWVPNSLRCVPQQPKSGRIVLRFL